VPQDPSLHPPCKVKSQRFGPCGPESSGGGRRYAAIPSFPGAFHTVAQGGFVFKLLSFVLVHDQRLMG